MNDDLRPSPVDGYRTRALLPSIPGAPMPHDELLGRAEGAAVVREAIDQLGATGLRDRVRAVERLVREEGISHGQVPGHPGRPWHLDPLPLVIDAAQWRTLEAAVQQRSRLMDALYSDLYGRRRVLENKLVPAEVVLGHRGFLPAADQVRLPGKRQLVITAQDLTRASDGSWRLLSDRVQAPAGAGLAMAQRRVVARAMSRLHRGVDLRRLRGFFDVVQAALQEAAHPVAAVPHVVVLGAGTQDPTAYDQAMLSTLLGYPLVQSDDLLMRQGRLWMRTTGQLAAVDVVLRGIDADLCDSLDLRGDSRLGVPGLASAAARQRVGIVNPLGSGVLENPGLIPFLGRVSQSLLGEALLLEQPETWWCGEDTSRQHVLSRLGELVVKPISRQAGGHSILGWRLDERQRDALARRIESEPWAWTGQEPVAGSTAPVVVGTGVEPRALVLRTFACALDGDYHVMPGGLGRVGGAIGEPVLTNSDNVVGKDVWVLDDGEDTPAPLDDWRATRVRFALPAGDLPGLSPRSAQNLYWMGRYVERAEVTARLVSVADNLVEDHQRRPATPGHAAMEVLLLATSRVTGVLASEEAAWDERPLSCLREVSVGERPGTLASSLAHMGQAHEAVRELLSLDTPAVIGGLQSAVHGARSEGAQVRLQRFSSRVLEACLALSGLAAENLVRDPAWAFLDAGRRIERAQDTCRLLLHSVARTPDGLPPGAEHLVVESVLRVGDSLLTHRRRMAAGGGPAGDTPAAVALLLSDASNPRSVLSQLERLSTALVHAPSVPVQAEVRDITAAVRSYDATALCAGDRSALAEALTGLEQRLRGLSDLLERTHFVHQAMPVAYEVPDDVLAEEMR